MKTLLVILLMYCAFAYGYGLSFLIECFKESLDKDSEWYKEDRPVFMAGVVFIFIWLLFPIMWPILSTFTIFSKEN